MSATDVTPLQDYPLAPRDREWDGAAAQAAIRLATGAENEPNTSYASCSFWHDASAPAEFGSYKLPYCDVIADEIYAVPHAIFAVAAVLDGARGGTDIPEADQEEIRKVVGAWYAKMAMEFGDVSLVAPWESS